MVMVQLAFRRFALTKTVAPAFSTFTFLFNLHLVVIKGMTTSSAAEDKPTKQRGNFVENKYLEKD
jgi:hypothetical protein